MTTLGYKPPQCFLLSKKKSTENKVLHTKTRLLTGAYIVMADVKNNKPVIGRKGKVEDDHVQNVSKETLQCF